MGSASTTGSVGGVDGSEGAAGAESAGASLVARRTGSAKSLLGESEDEVLWEDVAGLLEERGFGAERDADSDVDVRRFGEEDAELLEELEPGRVGSAVDGGSETPAEDVEGVVGVVDSQEADGCWAAVVTGATPRRPWRPCMREHPVMSIRTATEAIHAIQRTAINSKV